MNTFRSLLSGIICASLPIVSIGIANASGDAAKSFKDSTSNSISTIGVMTIKRGNVAEKNLTESYSLSSKLAPPGLRCDLSTRQVMGLDPENYRWHDEDVNSQFADPYFSGYKLQSARLCIKSEDVDFTSHGAYTPELNVVQFGKNTIGILRGNNGEQQTQCWNVESQLSDNTNSNIPFIVNVDAAHDFNHWAVYLHEAVLTTCHASVTKYPTPILQQAE